MDVGSELDCLVSEIRHFAGVIEGAFERAADLGPVRLRLGELRAGVLQRAPDLALFGGLQLFEDLAQLGELGTDVDRCGSRRQLFAEFDAESGIDRVAAPGDDYAAGYRAGINLV